MRLFRPFAGLVPTVALTLGLAVGLTVGVASADAARLAYDGLRAYDAGDSVEAAALWRRAAEEGSAYAMVALGGLLEQGDGVPRDPAAARAWYAAAAEAGDPHGMFLTAEALASADPAKSAEWLRRAAALGHPRAIRMLQSDPAGFPGAKTKEKR